MPEKNAPLTAEEITAAADTFFPLFDIVHRNMPENCTVEDTLKVMESVCKLAHKKRVAEEIAHVPFGFNKKADDGNESETTATE